MMLLIFDNVIKDPKAYVNEILSNGFETYVDGDRQFKGVMKRQGDELESFVTDMFTEYYVDLSFVRQSPYLQEEPNFKHKDDMMGDLTVILYLNELRPMDDGTMLYDEDEKEMCRIKSKFNRMIVFDSETLHSRSMFHNFGSVEDGTARLIQVMFLKLKGTT